MNRILPTTLLLLCCGPSLDAVGQQGIYPHFDYEVARSHELKPHRRTIPLQGVRGGFNQLRLRIVVSPVGDVVSAEAGMGGEAEKFWPQVQGEVYAWKFAPFEKQGKAISAEIEEYVDLVPPERLPTKHVKPPEVRPDSKVTIRLSRSGCYGWCPSYTVEISTGGIIFEGGGFVAAAGKHGDTVDADEVRTLAKRFVAADFYSMDSNYTAAVTDNPGYELSISIDGVEKTLHDYVGQWVGMLAVVKDLEEEVDKLADTDRWVDGQEGLVQSLRKEGFNFRSFEAQGILREAARRGQTATVRELLGAGVPLEPIRPPESKKRYEGGMLMPVGWLTSASGKPETLMVFIEAGASKKDQKDKDLALVGAARAGEVRAVKALIEYGANPNVDLKKEVVREDGGAYTIEGPGAGSVLLYAASSGNPEVVSEILRYHPQLEARDRYGKTALFAAGGYRYNDNPGARVECVRLLVSAGANVNVRDSKGNIPLHETFLTDVEEELLKSGADVNARNKGGETPIFTTTDDKAIPLFVEHGADLSIRNNEGKTVVEAAVNRGPLRQEALRKAIESAKTK